MSKFMTVLKYYCPCATQTPHMLSLLRQTGTFHPPTGMIESSEAKKKALRVNAYIQYSVAQSLDGVHFKTRHTHLYTSLLYKRLYSSLAWLLTCSEHAPFGDGATPWPWPELAQAPIPSGLCSRTSPASQFKCAACALRVLHTVLLNC